jgi:hypothetical protein
MDGVQGRSRYHSHTENQSVFQNSRIHANQMSDHRRRLPELKPKDLKEPKIVQVTSPSSKAPEQKLPQPVGTLKLDPKVKRALSI